jgi:hypothetical protein
MLNVQQERLIVALTQSATIRAACKKVGVKERTYRLWKDRPEFSAALDACRQACFKDGLAALKSALPRAVNVLVRRFRAKRDSDAIRAARAVLDAAVKTCELFDLQSRMETLERRLAERDKHPATYMNGHPPAANAAERNA